MTAAISSLVTAIAIPLVYWWLARKYPAPELRAGGPTLEELWPKYRKWELFALFAYLALWAPVSAAIYWPLHLVATWRAASMQDSAQTLVFFVDGAGLWIPSFFMALLLSAVILTPTFKALLKNRYSEYERYLALRFGFDQNRVMKGFSVAISVGFALGVFALFDTYAVASTSELRVNPFLSFERRYAYTDVHAVITAPALIAPNGNTVQRRVYLVSFKDGTSYSTDSVPEYEIRQRSSRVLVETILERSGLSLIEKSVFERGEL